MKTKLVIVPGRNQMSDDVFSILVAETGENLASHYCSNYSFAMGDLYSRRPERIEEWTKRFGEIEVVYIDDIDIPLDILQKRNKEWYESLPEDKKHK